MIFAFYDDHYQCGGFVVSAAGTDFPSFDPSACIA